MFVLFTDEIITLKHDISNFSTPIDMSYYCTREQTLSLNTTVGNASISLSHIQLQAFHKNKNEDFARLRDCDSIDTPDIVPIAVGISLVGLVLVVLIAYLVARRRSQARGYLSM